MRQTLCSFNIKKVTKGSLPCRSEDGGGGHCGGKSSLYSIFFIADAALYVQFYLKSEVNILSFEQSNECIHSRKFLKGF